MNSLSMIHQIWRFGLTFTFVLVVASHSFAQGGGGQPPGGNTGGPGNEGVQGPGGLGAEQTQGGQRGGRQEFTTDLNLGIAPIEIVDQRASGFVGPTAASIRETGFVGANSLSLSGGGGGGFRPGAGRGANGLVGAPGFGGAMGGFGTQGVFEVNRSPLRMPLINLISAPIKPAGEVEARLLDRIRRNSKIPQSGYELSVQDRTLTVRGSLPTDAADRLVRQLRLEPNIDVVVDELQRD